MSGDQLGRMYLERAAKLRPWDEWPSGRYIEDVDEAALWDFVERGRQNGRILSRFETSVDVLEAFGLMSGAELTNAAAVFSALRRTCVSRWQYSRTMLGPRCSTSSRYRAPFSRS